MLKDEVKKYKDLKNESTKYLDEALKYKKISEQILADIVFSTKSIESYDMLKKADEYYRLYYMAYFVSYHKNIYANSILNSVLNINYCLGETVKMDKINKIMELEEEFLSDSKKLILKIN